TDHPPDMLEGVERLAIGMQDLALSAREGLRSADRLNLVHLVLLGDRRKAHDVPRFLREDVADEIVFVQPLHYDHNRAVALVGELLAIADTEELDRRIVAETPGWEGDRGHQGFKMPRWQVDDQPPDRALPHRGQLGGDNFEVPVCRKRRLRVEFGKTALSKKI